MIPKKMKLPFVFLLTFILALALASCAAGGASEEVAAEAPEVTQEEAAAGPGHGSYPQRGWLDLEREAAGRRHLA
jgi:hypothetical protein